MKVSLNQALKAKNAFQKLVNTNLPIRVAFKLSRLAKMLNEILADIEEQRKQLVKKYGIQAGNDIVVSQDSLEDFHREFDDFLINEEITLDFEPIKLDMLDNVQLTAIEMLSLEPFIIE